MASNSAPEFCTRKAPSDQGPGTGATFLTFARAGMPAIPCAASGSEPGKVGETERPPSERTEVNRMQQNGLPKLLGPVSCEIFMHATNYIKCIIAV
jgi:hypothetical protein